MITLLDVKRRRCTWLALLVAAALALIFSYSWSGRGARPGSIKIGRDQSDVSGMAERGGMTGYDPYFDRVNYSGTSVLPGTNAMVRSR